MTTQEPLEVCVDEKGLERRTLGLIGPLEGRPYRGTNVHGWITAVTGGGFHQNVLAIGAQGVRTLVMSGDRHNLPHIMTLAGEEGENGEGERFGLLVQKGQKGLEYGLNKILNSKLYT